MLISGSEDCHTKLWDLRFPERLLATYSEHSGPVVKVRFNPEECTFSSCSIDKTAKYFRCEPNHNDYLSSTDMVSTPITAIDFSDDGKLLYAASNDMLKVWNMRKNGQLVETIEANWKGVQDIIYIKGALAGVASNGGFLSVWVCDLEKRIKANEGENEK
eukprot:GHVR01193213.1.p1 GENE.GHVR01193213.1~~GHVR01193213.1.p1  ORF type:complete len:160 (-),score=13.93 GHVR01193213.1:2568-3047(-)